MSETHQSMVCPSLDSLLVNGAMMIETSQGGNILHLSFVATLIRRSAPGNIDLPDLGSTAAQGQICLQEIKHDLETLNENLCETRDAKKLTSKLQSKHVKCACPFKIDHEAKVEERNLDRQANYGLWRLQQASARFKEMLEQELSHIVCIQEVMQAEVCPVSILGH